MEFKLTIKLTSNNEEVSYENYAPIQAMFDHANKKFINKSDIDFATVINSPEELVIDGVEIDGYIQSAASLEKPIVVPKKLLLGITPRFKKGNLVIEDLIDTCP